MINQNLNVNQTLPNLRTANLIDYVGPGSMRKKKASNAAAYWQLTFALHTSSTTSSCADIGKLCVCVCPTPSPGALLTHYLPLFHSTCTVRPQGARRLISHPCQRSYRNQLEESWDAGSCTCELFNQFFPFHPC